MVVLASGRWLKFFNLATDEARRSKIGRTSRDGGSIKNKNTKAQIRRSWKRSDKNINDDKNDC